MFRVVRDNPSCLFDFLLLGKLREILPNQVFANLVCTLHALGRVNCNQTGGPGRIAEAGGVCSGCDSKGMTERRVEP